MTKQISQRVLHILQGVLFALLLLPLSSFAQQAAPQKVIVVINYMKAAPGMADAYAQAEQETFLPMHQEHVKDGTMISWALYSVAIAGAGSDHDFVTADVYPSYAAIEAAGANQEAVFARAHPGQDLTAVVSPALAHREMLRREIWELVYTAGEPGPTQYLLVEYMKTRRGQDPLTMEREMWMPLHQARIQEGIIKHWSTYSLAVPVGSDNAYDYGTVNYFDSMVYFDDPYPTALLERALQGSDPEVLMEKTEAARDFVKQELWFRVAGTQPAAVN